MYRSIDSLEICNQNVEGLSVPIYNYIMYAPVVGLRTSSITLHIQRSITQEWCTNTAITSMAQFLFKIKKNLHWTQIQRHWLCFGCYTPVSFVRFATLCNIFRHEHGPVFLKPSFGLTIDANFVLGPISSSSVSSIFGKDRFQNAGCARTRAGRSHSVAHERR